MPRSPSPDEIRSLVLPPRRLAVLSGAGLSAESGVPTFRGAGGLWQGFRAEELATPRAFARNPEKVWEWYAWRRSIIAKTQPNPAHHALSAREAQEGFLLHATQNVDGLHHRAGSRRYVELHGTLWENLCSRCGTVRRDDDTSLPEIPRCPGCGGSERPNVVWFGESLDPDAIDRAARAVQDCETLLVVGTSGAVQPAASLAFLALRHGAAVIEVNLDPTPLSPSATVALHGKAAEILPDLLRADTQRGRAAAKGTRPR